MSVQLHLVLDPLSALILTTQPCMAWLAVILQAIKWQHAMVTLL